MAKDIRDADLRKWVPLAEECLRQEESALYTSTALFIWLREARLWNQFFIITPVVLGAAAGITFFRDPQYAGAASLLAILTGLFPAVREALRLDIHLDQIQSLAAEFKGLQDAFRQVARITAPENLTEASRRLVSLMDELARARSHSVTIPERIFKKAQKKVASGDYDFSVDPKRADQE